MIKETRLDLTDIVSVGIECTRCGTSVRLPIAPEQGLIPVVCPGCNESYTSNGLQQALSHLRMVYRELLAASGTDKKQLIRFHLRAE